MSCRVYRALACDRLDGLLRREEERVLLAHLALCRDCSERDEELADLRALLAASPAPEPPPGLERELLARAEADAARAEGRLHRALAWLFPRHALVPPTVAAAVVLLVLGLPGPARPPAGAAAPEASVRETSLLTVWDSREGTVVTSCDAHGLAPGSAPAPSATDGVRIFLFERIVVRG